MSNNHIQAPLGIQIHFRNGVHVVFPAGNRKFHLRVSCPVNEEVAFDGEVQSVPNQPVKFMSRQTYYIPWEVEIRQNGKLIFQHRLNLTGRDVCANLSFGALGDMVAWMPATLAFFYERNSRLTVVMKKEYISMFESVTPGIRFLPPEQLHEEDYYAIYPVGVWGYGNLDNNPTDFQKDNLIDHADHILSVDSHLQAPPLAAATQDCRAQYGKYVCIATRASRQMKQWNCEGGWEKVTSFLKTHGYRVFCIDADNQAMPANAEDFTGLRPLQERIDLIRGAEFFIGLASGLSWIAWACGKPTVVISGFSEEWTEFPTPYRIIDKSICHGCFNFGDMRFNEFDKCPANKDFECTRVITPERVIRFIEQIPGFASPEARMQKMMEYGPKISIMVPVFNSEKYLPACIHTILHQSYSKFELLLCDDQSTDRSWEIIQEFARQDKRIKVFQHKKNLGPLCARNTLIRAASGEYSLCVDSDDSIAEDFLECAVQKIQTNPYDILEFPCEIRRLDGPKILVTLPEFSVHAEHLTDLFLSQRRPHRYFLWGKFFKTQLLKDNMPPDQYAIPEDVFFTFQLFYQARSYCYAYATHAMYYYNLGVGIWGGGQTPATLEQFEARCRVRREQIMYNVNFMRKKGIAEKWLTPYLKSCELPELFEAIRRQPDSRRSHYIAVFHRYFGETPCLLQGFSLPIPDFLQESFAELEAYQAQHALPNVPAEKGKK